VCPLRVAEIHAQPIPARHPAQQECFRAAPWRPKTPAGLYPYPCAFSGGREVDRFIWGKHGSTISFALHVASKRDAGGFQLRVGDPSAFECLQTKLAKIDPEIPEAVPLRLPRWVFRYFTRFGINGIEVPPNFSWLGVAAGGRAQQEQGGGSAGRSSFLTNPTFTPILPVTVFGFSKTVINRGAQRVAVEFFPRGTIPNGNPQRRSVDRSYGV